MKMPNYRQVLPHRVCIPSAPPLPHSHPTRNTDLVMSPSHSHMGVTAVQPERKDLDKVIAVLKESLNEALASKQIQNA